MLQFISRKPRGNTLTGIVLVDDGVALAKVSRPGDGKPRVDACRFTPFDGGDREKSLHTLLHDAGASRTRCTTVMGRNEYRLLQVEAPDVPPTELRAAVRWRIKELIDFHIDDAVIDVFEIPGQRQGQARMMFAVAAHADKVRQRITLLEGAGARLDVIDIEEMALRNVASGLGDVDRGVIVLRFNEDHGLLTLTHGGNLYLTRRIETGSMDLFSAAQQADPANGDYGSELTGLFDGVILEIQRSLDYYDSHFSQAPVSTLLVAPSIPPLTFAPAYLDANLELDVQELLLESLVEGELPDDDLERAHCLTAIGAALRIEESVL